ncbi:MAG: AAA family ATPase [Saprospiraceae bacterium]|nr:AAA family ATPase [Saprospiraceae bacterium]
MAKAENIEILVNRLEKVRSNKVWNDFQKNKTLFELFSLILEESTSEERLNFTTLFSRLAFVGSKYNLKPSTIHYCHVFRKGHEQGLIKQDTEQIYRELGIYVCCKLLNEIWRISFIKQLLSLPVEVGLRFAREKQKIVGFKSVVEAVLFEIDTENKILLFYDEDDPDFEKKAKYDVHDKNELFNQNVDSLVKTFSLPVHLNLLDVEITDEGVYVPVAFVISPDHLIDVTAISECFKEFGSEPFLYLISKFKPTEATTALLVGNLVNFLLDELISDPDKDLKAMLPALFRFNPLAFAMMDDSEVKDVIAKLKDHYRNLKFAVKQEFLKFDISRKNIFLEPSFYSRDFGIQGRLDLLHQKKDTSVYDIIELKSGKTFKPNIYGINASHYIQTLLYDLMIRSVFQKRTKSFNYILYSRESDKPLRFAPPVKAKQFEAMKLRNDLLAIEQKLLHTDEDDTILKYIKPENFPKLKGFNRLDIENFYNIYSTLDLVSKGFFDHFTSFIAREQSMAKTGESGINKSNGHAALWLESDDEKKERFSLLAGLVIEINHSSEEEAFITFSRNSEEFELVNFRIGDIAVLYPSLNKAQKPVLRNQIFKCTITNLTSDRVEIKLRNKQYNQSLFQAYKFWCLEQDNLDSGFNAMYRSLFLWAGAPLEYRNLHLGLTKPRSLCIDRSLKFDSEVTEHQSELLQKMIAAQDYFLLWGPPGTGKTSIMLKSLGRHLYENTFENILLLAYTNRAVDEICDAVMSIDESYGEKFLRIGSRLSTDSKYESQLLDQQIKWAKTRNEILELLLENRIYISTVSSIINKTELFNLKEFDTVIIDEASQILEPMLAGLLSKFKRFILIGDHKQLPAVVVQHSGDSLIKLKDLHDLGFYNTRTSLFERLYHRVIGNEWHDAFGILSQQGRMHEELMAFPNEYFYENKLELIPGSVRQSKPDFFDSFTENTSYLQHRKIFIDTQENGEINWKTNLHEALKCVDIIQDICDIFMLNNIDITHESIGIITPYRAQIALIRKCMESLPKELSEKITVDTVERYQGGARDIIIISFCVNRLSQLESLVSLSQEGIDRKLNVALTRAKEQIILVGNKKLLSDNKGYLALISHYEGTC